MDDSYLSGFVYLVSALLAVLRLINNLMKAGFFGLGRISLLALAEKARESNTRLVQYLDDSSKFILSAQIFDKLTLCLLILFLLQATPVLEWHHFLWFFLYLLAFDLILPNSLAAYYPEALVVKMFPVMRWPFYLISPFTSLMTTISKNRRDIQNVEEAPEDVKAFLQAGTEEGIIEEKEKLLIHNLLNFNDTVVREVMTPRTDMVCIDITTPKDAIMEVFRETKFSRLPVYREDIDHIEGVLRFKDMLELMNPERNIKEFITEVLFVPEQKNISDQLQEMLKLRLQMAIVIDEFGGTAGLVTLEDLIEEIVGEIHDEHEAPDSDEIIDLEDGAFLVDGKVLLDDFCEMFSIQVESDDVDTVGGFIFNREGRIPKEGDTSSIGDLKVEITKADERRIYKVMVRPEPEKMPVEVEGNSLQK